MSGQKAATAGTSVAPAPSAFPKRIVAWTEPLLIPILLVVLWQAAALRFGEVAFASPIETLEAILDGFERGWLSGPVLETVVVTGAAFAVAAIAGLWVGFTLGLAGYWGRVLEGPILWVYSIPKVTLFPIFLLFLGLGYDSKVAFGAFHGFFPLVLFVLAAMRATPEVLLKVARVYNLNRWQTFWRVIVPDILPSMVTGLRYCFSLSFLGIILAEMFMSRSGAGFVLIQNIGLHRPDRIFAVAVTLVILAFAVNSVFLVIQGRVGAHRGDGDSAVPPS